MKTTFLTIFLLSCSFGYINAQSSKTDVIERLLNQCHEQGFFNGVALVADEGKIIVHKSYGISDLKTQSPLKRSDRFYIGSLTKQFTSVLILQLQEEGFIDIHKPLSLYLEEFNDTNWSEITVHQLLTHTSGFGSYTFHEDFDKSLPYTDQQMFEFIKHPLLFKPGSSWTYSNSGYFLLGKIAERATGKDYGALLKQHIFEPLQMKNSSFSVDWLKEDFAKGHIKSINGTKPMPIYSAVSLLSTGGIYSTAEDLFIWTQALHGNKILSDTSREILFQPVQNDYACGFYVKRGVDENGNEFERHFHGGMIQGYHSFILNRVPQKQVIILLDNFYSQEIQTIKNRIWSALEEYEIKPIKPTLSSLLFTACSEKRLDFMLDSISNNLKTFENRFTFDEFDINKVGYHLMKASRHSEASILFNFNMKRYPESWNVYDSMGELQLRQRNYNEAEKLYKRSLALNPKNNSAINALKKIELLILKH